MRKDLLHLFTLLKPTSLIPYERKDHIPSSLRLALASAIDGNQVTSIGNMQKPILQLMVVFWLIYCNLCQVNAH